MNIAVVSIGNEILNGSIVDTNSNYIVKTLASYGYYTNEIVALGDDIGQINNEFEFLSKKYDLVITTGGLGPTFDDRTTECLASAAKAELKLDKKVYFDVIKKVKSKGVNLKLSHLRQAYLPLGCEIINNDYGTACGILMKINTAYFVSMPGVPSEMKPMFKNYVLDKIRAMFPRKDYLRYDLKLVGVAESDMDEFLKKIDTNDVEIILNAQEGELAVRVFAAEQGKLDYIYNAVFNEFGNRLYSKNDEAIEDSVDELLQNMNMKLGIIESFTGGYLSFLMSEKKSFANAVINHNENLDNFGKIKGADIAIFPSSLEDNLFSVNIHHEGKIHTARTRYMGNKNFMKKSSSKRALGHLYEFLKSLDFSREG